MLFGVYHLQLEIDIKCSKVLMFTDCILQHMLVTYVSLSICWIMFKTSMILPQQLEFACNVYFVPLQIVKINFHIVKIAKVKISQGMEIS